MGNFLKKVARVAGPAVVGLATAGPVGLVSAVGGQVLAAVQAEDGKSAREEGQARGQLKLPGGRGYHQVTSPVTAVGVPAASLTAMGADPSPLLAMIAQQLGVDLPPEAVGAIVGGLTWLIHLLTKERSSR